MASSPIRGHIYSGKEAIRVVFTFSAAISVTGTPTLEIQVGSNARSATCAAHSGDNTKLVCSYTILKGDKSYTIDSDGNRVYSGIVVGNSKLATSTNVSIKNSAGTADATLTYSLPDGWYDDVKSGVNANHYVDGAVPSAPTRIEWMAGGLSGDGADGDVLLLWRNPGDTDITGYQVSYSPHWQFHPPEWTDISNSGASTTSHTINVSPEESWHYVWLRAKYGSGSTTTFGDWTSIRVIGEEDYDPTVDMRRAGPPADPLQVTTSKRPLANSSNIPVWLAKSELTTGPEGARYRVYHGMRHYYVDYTLDDHTTRAYKDKWLLDFRIEDAGLSSDDLDLIQWLFLRVYGGSQEKFGGRQHPYLTDPNEPKRDVVTDWAGKWRGGWHFSNQLKVGLAAPFAGDSSKTREQRLTELSDVLINYFDCTPEEHVVTRRYEAVRAMTVGNALDRAKSFMPR